jgi:hypothetical protein
MSMNPQAIASLPLWLAGLMLTGGAVLGAIVIELTARRLIPQQLREEHNAAASAMFTVVGTTYAVLLAFVAMLAWEGFNRAQAVADAEASLAQTVYQLTLGLTGPEMTSMRHDITAYTQAVVSIEWPAQTHGIAVAEQEPNLQHLFQTALHLRPDNIADGDLHTLLLKDLTDLGTSRRERLFAASTSIPSIVWFVLIAGGAISVAFASLLGAPNLLMHLTMSSLLALSGALVPLVIVALSNPFRGDLRISDEPFNRVLMQMAMEP